MHEQTEGFRGGRVLFGGLFMHAVAEFSVWITLLVVAFDRGGASAAGLAIVVQLAPAALLAPVVSAAGDRFARDRVLVVAFATQTVAAAAIALALQADTSLAVVYALAAVFTVASVAAPATVASLLVHHAESPAQLVRWNVAKSLARAAGSLVGPLLTALVLAVSVPSAVFAGVAVGLGVFAVVVHRWLQRDDRLTTTVSARAVLADATGGLLYVATNPAPRGFVAFLGATELLIGAVDLLVVALVFERLGNDGSVVALFATAFAAGTLLMGVVASRYLPRRLGRALSAGALLLTLPLLAIGETTTPAIVLTLAVLLGIGNGLIEISTHTLLQRSCSETMTSRVFGVLDSTAMIAAAVGAVVAGRLIDSGGLDATLLGLGTGGAIVLLGASLRLGAVERSLPAPDSHLTRCLRSVSFLQPLPRPTIDRLALASQRRSVPSGCRLVVEGDTGDEFFVLTDGSVDVSVNSEVVQHLVAPASFGEIALVLDGHRRASVTTTEPSELAVIGREEFLDAIGRTATSHRLALEVAKQPGGPSDPARPDPLG